MYKASERQAPPRLTVGFWNTQRATNPALYRAQFMIGKVQEWIALAPPPDVIILAEVTQKGAELRDEFNRLLPAYQAEFVAVADGNGDVSPCSFLVLGRRVQGGNFSVQPVGASSRRPYILVAWNNLTIAGIHATADQGAKALNDICDVANDFRGTVIIGDMNLDPSVDHGADLQAWEAYVTQVYDRHVPRDFTYQSRRGRLRVLDYALVRRVAPVPWQVRRAPAPTAGFETIDHAPIAFAIA